MGFSFKKQKSSKDATKSTTQKPTKPQPTRQKAPKLQTIPVTTQSTTQQERQQPIHGSQSVRRKKKAGSRSTFKKVSTPLLTVTESPEEHPGTATTVTETPGTHTVLSSLNVASSGSANEEAMEVYWGDAPSPQESTAREATATTKEENEETINTISGNNTNIVAEDEPFDAKAEYFEKDEVIGIVPVTSTNPVTDVTRQLLHAFNCNYGISSSCAGADFYDSPSTPFTGGRKRPYFDQEFTLAFLQQTITEGTLLLYHQPPSSEDEDWAGRSANLIIKHGDCNATNLLQPKLEWSTEGGGNSKVRTVSVGLLDIQAVHDSIGMDEEQETRDDNDPEPEDELTFFSITTNRGTVHIFETNTRGERDRIVNGLKNIIARLAFHLVAGDTAISSELFAGDEDETCGELPTLRKPGLAMTDISHVFLDE